MDDVALAVERITRFFGKRAALRDLSFTARRGDVVGLLGPNGAGKTTAIRLLSTVLSPTGGRFTVAGVPHTRPLEIRRRIGVLPESAGYPGHDTGREYLRFHARLSGLTRTAADRTASRMLAEVGLTERGSSRISSYSRGMRQRLGIARALLTEPAVIFLDEPTLGLDPAGQQEVRGIVRRIASENGTAVVLSTHILPEVEESCSAVVILDRGTVRLTGTVAEVMKAAGMRRSARLRVPADLIGRAGTALNGMAGVTLEAANDGSGVLTLSTDERDDEVMNLVLRRVLAAHVPILGFEVDGAGLGTAFLALTDGEIR
ncbi:ABC transporter ATP-binding protein [Amycolatopsis sp. NPDC049868]|uniref:ABC transporter ATP-binding protein n=1 Tax=Amycolatopsis sp. NPDC049868 TaxID=3363934 RepID=UPI0037A935AB